LSDIRGTPRFQHFLVQLRDKTGHVSISTIRGHVRDQVVDTDLPIPSIDTVGRYLKAKSKLNRTLF
jgi:hypothetical protein